MCVIFHFFFVAACGFHRVGDLYFVVPVVLKKRLISVLDSCESDHEFIRGRWVMRKAVLLFGRCALEKCARYARVSNRVEMIQNGKVANDSCFFFFFGVVRESLYGL